MKMLPLSAKLAAAICSAVLISCGGGGDDEAGSLTPFSVVPSTLTFTAAVGSPPGVCPAGFGAEVFIYGGAAPYRLNNSAPDAVILNKSQVGDRGGSFTVTFTGQCVDPASVVIVDKNDRQVILTLTSKSAT